MGGRQQRQAATVAAGRSCFRRGDTRPRCNLHLSSTHQAGLQVGDGGRERGVRGEDAPQRLGGGSAELGRLGGSIRRCGGVRTGCRHASGACLVWTTSEQASVSSFQAFFNGAGSCMLQPIAAGGLEAVQQERRPSGAQRRQRSTVSAALLCCTGSAGLQA